MNKAEEILKGVLDEFLVRADAYLNIEDPEKLFHDILSDAGLVVEQGWCSDMEKAPRDVDGDKLQVFNGNSILTARWSEDGFWTDYDMWNSVHECWEDVKFMPQPTHWRIPTPPQDKGEEDNDD